jgi:hypothetical protein
MKPLCRLTRGFPVDTNTLLFMLKKQHQDRIWSYVFRLLVLWVYSHDVPEDDRTDLMTIVQEKYTMLDWVADMLSAIFRCNVNYETVRMKFINMKRENIGYDPPLYAQMLQLQEMTDVRGCPFTNSAFTLNKCLVCGSVLFSMLGVARSRSQQKKMTGFDRLVA